MTEALGLSVAIVINRTLLLLGAVVPGQLQQTLPLGDGVLCTFLDSRVGGGISQEVQVKGGILVFRHTQELHAHDLLVELEAGLGRLDADHGVVQSVASGVRGRAHVGVVAADDLDPVAVRVLGESNVLHATVGELLLKGVAGIFDSLASGLDVVDRDGDVAKAAVRFGVSVDHAVVGITLGAVVVGEFENSVAIGPVAVALQGSRSTVGEEVEGKLVLGKVQLLDLVQSEEIIEFN